SSRWRVFLQNDETQEEGVQRSVARAEGLKELEGFKAYKTAERLGKLSEETGELGQSVA
ncbi:unnamed protein product, partial [Symbiodinium pilosum]